MSAVRILQKVLDEELLRVFGQLEHLPAQRQRVDASGHHALELLQQGKLGQHAGQDGPVEAPAVVSHQKGPAEGLEEADEVAQSPSVRDGLYWTAFEEQVGAVYGQTRDSRRAVRHRAARQHIHVKPTVAADGRQLHDITRSRV